MLLLLSLSALAVPADCDIPKALYAWNCATTRTLDGEANWWHLYHDTNGCAQKLIDLATGLNIERVYLYVGAVEWHQADYFSQGRLPEEDAIADLTARMRAAGIEPWAMWYLNDAVDNLDNHEDAVDVISAVASFNAAHPDGTFAGAHGDQEPNDARVYPDYLEMNALGLQAADKLGLGWGASLKPAWLTIKWEGSPLIHAAAEGVSLGTLMDYTDDIDKATRQGTTWLAAADAAGIRGEIAVETGWSDPTPGVSFSELVAEDPEAFFDALVTMDAAFSAHTSYDGIAIHDYAQFFAGLYGEEPYDYTGEITPRCSEPDEEPDTGDTDTDAPTTEEKGSDTGGCGSKATVLLGLGLGLWVRRRRDPS